MVKCAHRHVFEITALFGVSACDEQEPCDDEGRLRPTANPWAHQIAGDIQALSYPDNAVEFKKIYKGKLLNLWLDEDTKGLFLKLDATELRAQEKSVAISITEEKKRRGGKTNILPVPRTELWKKKKSRRKEGY